MPCSPGPLLELWPNSLLLGTVMNYNHNYLTRHILLSWGYFFRTPALNGKALIHSLSLFCPCSSSWSSQWSSTSPSPTMTTCTQAGLWLLASAWLCPQWSAYPSMHSTRSQGPQEPPSERYSTPYNLQVSPNRVSPYGISLKYVERTLWNVSLFLLISWLLVNKLPHVISCSLTYILHFLYWRIPDACISWQHVV